MSPSSDSDHQYGRIAVGVGSVLLIVGSTVSMIGYLGMRIYSAQSLVTPEHLRSMTIAAVILGVLSTAPVVLVMRRRSAMYGGFRHWHRLLPVAAGAAALWLVLGTASLTLGI